MFKKIFFIGLILVFALSLSACEKQASTPPPDADSVEADMAAYFSETQTAMAAGTSGDGEPKDVVMTNTPEPETVATEEPTAEPTEKPTLKPTDEPTDESQPTETEEIVVATDIPDAGDETEYKTEKYIVKEGENAYCIAQRYNVNFWTLLVVNDLLEDNVVYAGQTLQIPQDAPEFTGDRSRLPHPDNYTVVAGDTLNIIACKYGDVGPAQIARANGEKVDWKPEVGSTIKIP
ncbi:MAG: LysM peptidoglycan-binding domain-containing protein [Anaerolineales bacterium]|nr:LysM peptidoglycan-binding domain-containing protein [Anaerolineales bacterium]